jgi:hypothetical protein
MFPIRMTIKSMCKSTRKSGSKQPGTGKGYTHPIHQLSLGLGTGAGRALSRKWAVMIPRTVPTSIGGVFQPSTNTTNMEIEPTKSTNIHM